tara:strand:+ start:493 stop:1368 length:876 start_codon:yes stop_codon:yes gene_type:complete
MIPSKIFEKVKRIEIRTRGLVNNLFGGEYHSIFKGRGIAFSEVREYHPGDPIRLIDWNVTARIGAPYVKVFEEERELTVYLVVDISASGKFGSFQHLKQELGAEIAAVLGFSAIKNNDKVGLILFSENVEKFIVPKKGKTHVMRVIRELLYFKPKYKGTILKNSLDFISRVAKRKSVIFIISDFIDDGFWTSLKILNKKHDILGIKLIDPSEVDFPDIGLAKIEDQETQKVFWIDTNSKDLRRKMKENVQIELKKFNEKSKKIGLDIINIFTDQDFVEPLLKYFKMREKRN